MKRGKIDDVLASQASLLPQAMERASDVGFDSESCRLRALV
jgi:hypothetical protein